MGGARNPDFPAVEANQQFTVGKFLPFYPVIGGRDQTILQRSCFRPQRLGDFLKSAAADSANGHPELFHRKIFQQLTGTVGGIRCGTPEIQSADVIYSVMGGGVNQWIYCGAGRVQQIHCSGLRQDNGCCRFGGFTAGDDGGNFFRCPAAGCKYQCYGKQQSHHRSYGVFMKSMFYKLYYQC